MLIVRTVALCASNVVALHRSRRLKRGNRRRARTNRTNNGRGESRPQSRQRVNVFFVSMSKSRVTGGWLSQPVISCPPGVNARIPRLLQWPGKEAVHEVIVWVWGSVRHGNAMELYYWKAWLMGVQIGKHRACCCMSWWRAHLWSCVRRFVAASPRGGHAVLPGYSVLEWFGLIQDLDTSLVVFLRGVCSGLGPPEGGIVYGLFSKEALYTGKASVSRTHSPGLAARLTEHFRCLYRLGLKDANKPPYRLLRRKLWNVRFFPLAVFPTISQTLSAEALAISMEAPMGNARDAAEERRLRRKGENAMVRAPRRRPSSWRWRQRRPWENIWGCSDVKEVLSNQSRGKPVQFPGALGLDFPFSPLYTAQIREERAYYGFQGPLYLFDPCWLGLFLAYCAKGSNRSNFPWIRLPRWPRMEIASYLCGACKHVSEFLKLPSTQCSASRVLDYPLRFHSYHQKEFQFFRCLRSSRMLGQAKIPRCHWSHALWASA